jgi:hypothetical protein
MSWAEHVACMGDVRNHTKFWSEYLKGRDDSEGLGVDGNILWKCGRKEDEMGGVCSVHGRHDKSYKIFIRKI